MQYIDNSVESLSSSTADNRQADAIIVKKVVQMITGVIVMTEFTKVILSRIGTCRSGTKFDVPHELDDSEIDSFWNAFDLDDRIDIFCMIESKIVSAAETNNVNSSDQSIRSLNQFVWKTIAIDELKPYLEAMGLYTSAAYVQFGQSLLL